MGCVVVGVAARVARWALAFAIVVAAPAVSWAQYFGTNKVLYKPQHFRILETEHFDIYFHGDDRAAADRAAVLAERWRRRFTRFFEHELEGRQPLVLYSSHPDFEQTTILESAIDIGTRGVTEGSRRRIILSVAGSLSDTAHVIGHELVHAFQFDLFATVPPMQRSATASLPLWFIEGLAEFLTLGPVDTHTAMWLRDAALLDDLPSVDELNEPRRFPYRWGHAFTAYVAARWGERALADLFTVAMFHGVHEAIERVLELTEKELSDAWHASIFENYVSRFDQHEPIGVPLIWKQKFGGSINVGPSLSPDGRWLAFLSERDLFGIDLFVADARTGESVRRLTDTAADPSVSGLQFVDAASAWDRASQRLAMAAVKAGRPAIAIFGWPDGARQRDVVVRELDEITGLTWSPDGRSMAFSGLTGGMADLFVYDLEHSSLRRLTHDIFADLQPAWSPDGRRLAFVTDRFTTDRGTLTAGAYRLALIDVDNAAIEQVTAFATGKHLNPQWSADSGSLYFVSDHDGISNLYRVELESRALTQLTRAATGISGLSASSPSISIATGVQKAAVAVFEAETFTIHTLDLDAGRATDVPAATSQVSAEAPVDQPEAAGTTDAHTIPPTPYPVSTYRPRLTLEGISPASFTVGVDRYGAAFGSGIAVAFSDVLNTHRLVTAVQLNQGFGAPLSLWNHAFYGAYVNRARRWNWGLIGSTFPSMTNVRSSARLPNGEVVSTTSLIKQTERGVTFAASYALNRARRIELQSGWGRLTFDRAIADTDEELEWTVAAAPLSFATVSAAVVRDTASAGATSVVRGERYRFEVTPVFGTLRHLSVLADYRKYVMPVPFYTIAARALHVGRYGSGAHDPRLTPLYLGYPAFVRGYDQSPLVTSECVTALAEECEGIDQLVGSRLAVGNLEFRFPLLRPFGLSPRMYGPVPVEVAIFLDGGLVWRKTPTPSNARPAGAASSAGVSLRVNLAGLGLSQFDVARRLQGRQSGWAFQFNFVPPF